MRGIPAHPQPAARRRRHGHWLTLVIGILAALALAPASAPAAQSGPPVIESVGSGAGGEITIDAKINPEGLETTYEIGLECSPCGPGDQWATGTLPAVHESRAVTLTLTGLQPGRRYWFAVRASNANGEESRRSETLEVPPSPGLFPEGTGGGGIVEAPYIGATSGQLKEIAIEEEQRRAKEKEAEEQKARELTARPASELEHTEEQPPAAHTPAEHPACRVLALKGDTLTAARRALAKAHCRLGTVHRPAHLHGTLHVSAQGAPAGKQLAHGARVVLWCGAKGSGEKRASRRG